ncbi:N-acetyl-1-D-myo-inositol-2-amino-2-deoxy-alpha-D-glucopyranoside deacetylase [Streptomyces sp. CMB-StM0423]|uniref:N-acetyl-1-D-myo-inositol-2-amino-2-deoxy-alpha- D-glucopyranoside deacetylase n=1 Tax=Streptomyces sp. CMB-StM0423 TaxID=2059884 RepID=UPI000C7075C5|nr:N-acetyl-1-D-myo-inositol-2-amino-2-deoxy-alpha-D-glucopyranoside deacetylase [Streptomyces sp. CMB-StM0423]AUH40808.1 N-acetyl-1-D-myo-inositol-2-amino-2-deoxy-alpha-D-glucopyranoside deacetylase [Streptomyces sp. CMB-StM0423]
MSRELPRRRLLLVHAHPDDETITTGATMARYAAEGALVTLVTCTRGEEGEVIPPALARLGPERDDALGPHRAGELAAAMRALGVTDHRFLGGPGRFRDSGMQGLDQNGRPGTFWSAGVDEAAGLLVPVIRGVRPQVLVTYDPRGGYGHPDHVQAHRVATRAAELAAAASYGADTAEPWAVARIYWTCIARSAAEKGLAELAAAGHHFPGTATVADLPGVVDDGEVTSAVAGGAYAAAKARAMAAHETQITVAGGAFALSNGLGQPILTTEQFRLAGGAEAARRDPGAVETDLFAEVAA